MSDDLDVNSSGSRDYTGAKSIQKANVNTSGSAYYSWIYSRMADGDNDGCKCIRKRGMDEKKL